jgi:thioredoxin reductase
MTAHRGELVTTRTDLLIIGAGPFGLAVAAWAGRKGVAYVIAGKPMGFWKENMPAGMLLRSGSDWHLDPSGECTIDRFREMRPKGNGHTGSEPLSLEFYLEYAQWFQEQHRIDVIPTLVHQLDLVDGAGPTFRATMDNGDVIVARRVVVAVGFKYFTCLPQALVDRLPPGRFSHTCDLVDFTALNGKRCLIVGGRQSAFEWAALIHEAGAAAVHITHRHDSPAFAVADWSWVMALAERTLDEPDWYRRLSAEEQKALGRRFWAEGRLKIEPWLESRIRQKTIAVWPRTGIVACEERPGGDLRVQLEPHQIVEVDHIILATGYAVRIDQVPFLRRGNILSRLEVTDGSPALDENFQTSVPNLFITSMAAAQEFGPFVAFTLSARISATLIGRAISSRRARL